MRAPISTQNGWDGEIPLEVRRPPQKSLCDARYGISSS